MKIWYSHGQNNANGLRTNKISYKIFDLRHLSKVAPHFQNKNKMFIYSFKYSNEESGKIFKKRGCRAVLRTMPNISDGEFLRKYNG